MRVPDPRFVIMVAGLAWLTGCAGNPVPQQWRQPARMVQHSPRGGWIRIETMETSASALAGPRFVQGELIAVDRAAIHVLTVGGLQSVPATSVRHATLVAYETSTGAFTAWAIAGGVSTLSHGGFLLFTAPTWAVGGIIAVHTEGRAGKLHEAVARFARFPQGLPAGVDPQSLGTLRAVTPRPGDR